MVELQGRINAIEWQIKLCEERAASITANMTGNAPATSGGTSSKVSLNAEAIADYESDLRLLCNELKAFQHRATMEINKIKDNVCTALLINKYVNGFSWERTAQEIDKDVDYTRKELHSKALLLFEKCNPENT